MKYLTRWLCLACIKCSPPVFWRMGWIDVFTALTALKDGYEKVEQDLPAFEDLEGAARALMRLQDVYMLNVKGLAQGVFQRVTGSAVTDLYSPRRLFSLTADDCFQVGKVTIFRERANCSALISQGWNNYILIAFTYFQSFQQTWKLGIIPHFQMKKPRIRQGNNLPKVTQF